MLNKTIDNKSLSSDPYESPQTANLLNFFQKKQTSDLTIFIKAYKG